MRSKINTFLLLMIAIFLGIIAFQICEKTIAQTQAETDNPELLKLFNEDQADRSPEKMSAPNLDFHAFEERDLARQKRVQELYKQNLLKTGNDFYHAAMILQHGSEPEDFLLAHEFSVVAISKGNKDAKWLAAASEDRFLMNIGRPQRFGTQFRSDPLFNGMKLYPVAEGVIDDLRKLFGVRSLAKTKERETKINQNK